MAGVFPHYSCPQYVINVTQSALNGLYRSNLTHCLSLCTISPDLCTPFLTQCPSVSPNSKTRKRKSGTALQVPPDRNLFSILTGLFLLFHFSILTRLFLLFQSFVRQQDRWPAAWNLHRLDITSTAVSVQNRTAFAPSPQKWLGLQKHTTSKKTAMSIALEYCSI